MKSARFYAPGDIRIEDSPEPVAGPAEVKIRFKSLVKRHHPDANNGDRSTEDKLREIIQAYNYLKTAGYR